MPDAAGLLEWLKAGAAAVAGAAAGAWVVLRYVQERAGATRLAIRLRTADVGPTAGGRLVFVDVVLRNIGKAVLRAGKQITAGEAASLDEPIEFPCEMRLKRVRPGTPAGELLGWFSERCCDPVEVDGATGKRAAINLIHEYTYDSGECDFWMEPGETYHLGQAIALAPGTYLAKVTFIGSKGDLSNFWTRTFCFTVQAGGTAGAPAEPARRPPAPKP